MNHTEIENKLTRLAYQKTQPFCLGCYVRVSKTSDDYPRCQICNSDDLARELPGDGIDWGVESAIRALLREALTPVDTAEAFEESMSQCYPETTAVAWLELDTVTILKQLDPVSWDIAEGEWIDAEVSEGNLMTFDNGTSYYWTHEVESYLDESETNKDAA